MNIDFDTSGTNEWIDDLGGLSFDELREMPWHVQTGLDVAVYE